MSLAGAWWAGPAAARVSILSEESVGAPSTRRLPHGWLGGLWPRGRVGGLFFRLFRVGAVPAGRGETVQSMALRLSLLRAAWAFVDIAFGISRENRRKKAHQNR